MYRNGSDDIDILSVCYCKKMFETHQLM